MIRNVTLKWWRFWVEGDELSIRTGKALALCALTGLLAGLAASGFYWLLEVAHYLLVGKLANFSPPPAAGEKGLLHSALTGPPLKCVLLVLPAAGALFSSLLIRWLAPTAAGHGTDAAINAYHREEGRIPFMVIPMKALASAIVIGSGGSAGCEGPVTQIGAGCGSVLAKWLGLNVKERRILLAAGLAAGVGAIFRAPLAGAIFAAEIFYSGLDIEYEVMVPSLVASTIAYTVFALFFGWQPLFTMPHFAFDNAWKLFPYMILAIVVALGSKFYVIVFRQSEMFWRSSKLPAWSRPCAGGLITGAIGFFIPQVLGSGYGWAQQALNLSSPVGDNPVTITVATLLLCFFGKVIATSCTVGSGGSGGLFGPALVSGALLGAACGLVMAKLFPTMGIFPGSFAMVGMAGFLASAIRVPIAAIIMVSEITGNHELLLPSMWVCGIAYLIGYGKTLYRSQVRTRDCSPAHSGGNSSGD
jgi:CIC family chloride channel protein